MIQHRILLLNATPLNARGFFEQFCQNLKIHQIASRYSCNDCHLILIVQCFGEWLVDQKDQGMLDFLGTKFIILFEL